MKFDWKYVYLIGIGGIGMSALARYFQKKGIAVGGYDKTFSDLTGELEAEGMEIHYSDSEENIPYALSVLPKEEVLVIYTPAIPNDHSELNFLRGKGYQVKKRAEVLGWVTREEFSIAVAGTHGKTTTSTMISHLIKHSERACNAFLGGISVNYSTNLLLDESAEYTVLEADEYDRSFLQLYPNILVVTSLDPDHLDIYGDANEMVRTYQEFVDHLDVEGILIHRSDLSLTTSSKSLTYSITETADLMAKNIRVEDGYFVFDLDGLVQWKSIRSGFPGIHNVENALAAILVAISIGLGEQEVRSGLDSFRGVKRRFERVWEAHGRTYIDDYAHHPAELDACIRSVKKLFPGKKITGVFQPHLFSRTRDFAEEFAATLDSLDVPVLLEIYPARELPIKGIDSSYLLSLMKNEKKQLVEKEKLPQEIVTDDLEVLLTLGAGDIDRCVEPIRKKLEETFC